MPSTCAQAYAALPGAVLLKPLVVAGAGLAEGQLVDARIPHPEGGSYPYGGRVLRVVEGSGGQQLAILDFDLAATYELLPGDPLVREGVMPEFVTYRQGPSQQAPGDMSEPELEYFGPEERSGIKGPRGLAGRQCTGASQDQRGPQLQCQRQHEPDVHPHIADFAAG